MEEAQDTNQTITELEQCFLRFARATISKMKQWMLEDGMYGHSYLAHIFNEQGYSREMGLVHEYATFLQSNIKDLLAMEETQQCIERHLQTHAPLPSLENTQQNETSTEDLKFRVVLDLLVPLIESCKLHAVLTSQEQLILPNDEQLLIQYRRLITLWNDPVDRMDITFPIVNFFCGAKEPQPLSKHLFLAPLNPADKTALYNEDIEIFHFSSPPLEAQVLMYISWKLAGTYAFQRNNRQEQSDKKQEVLNELNDVLTALRLIKKGDAGTPALYEKRKTPVFYEGMRLANIIHDHQVRQFPMSRFENYELSEHEIPDLQAISDALRQLRIGSKSALRYGDMEVALRRFNQSYNRDLPEDQIIDLTIALEGSLLADLREELNYRLSLRGAALLAPAEKWEPSKSQTLLKAMYDIRSRIVHSGQLLTDLGKDIGKLQQVGIESHEFVQWCGDIVRDVLRAYILREAKGQSLKEINKELDQYITKSLVLQLKSEAESPSE